jgi:copper chaperone NosL
MNAVIKVAIVIGLAVLAGCGKEESAAVPPPVATAADATGHYCGMLLAEHSGPKGQILLKSGGDPVWFTSVRDTFTFLALPEEPKDVAAVYVSDMGKAPSWEKPGDQNWILAETTLLRTSTVRSDGTRSLSSPTPTPASISGGGTWPLG